MFVKADLPRSRRHAGVDINWLISLSFTQSLAVLFNTQQACHYQRRRRGFTNGQAGNCCPAAFVTSDHIFHFINQSVSQVYYAPAPWGGGIKR